MASFLALGTSLEINLSLNCYDSTCPLAVSKIREIVNEAIRNETRMGASLLRLHFHDCFVNGCDGSVLLDDVAPSFIGEKTAPPNDNSLRGYEVIDKIKAAVESLCPGVVSCADILTVAARDAVVAVSLINYIFIFKNLGGPSWQVLLGRKDSTTASFSDALENLPSPFIDFNDLAAAFAQKGFSSREMITLSGSTCGRAGAHTVGKAKCATYRQRAHGDSNIDSGYAAFLKSVCPPSSGGDDNLAPLDNSTTKDVFDVGYYRSLANRKGLLHSDQALLPNGGAANSQVNLYNTILVGSLSFFSDFANAMVKMGNLTGPAGNVGQIRTNCRRVN
ncbi:Cationic peroxidase 1 [Linum perenne]